MAHRITSRTPVRLDVELWHRGSSLGSYRTRNIDTHAVFIEAPELGLRIGDVLGSSFLVDPQSSRSYSLKGSVARCAGDGFVMMFVSNTTDLLQALDELLFSPACADSTSLSPGRYSGGWTGRGLL